MESSTICKMNVSWYRVVPMIGFLSQQLVLKVLRSSSKHNSTESPVWVLLFPLLVPGIVVVTTTTTLATTSSSRSSKSYRGTRSTITTTNYSVLQYLLQSSRYIFWGEIGRDVKSLMWWWYGWHIHHIYEYVERIALLVGVTRRWNIRKHRHEYCTVVVGNRLCYHLACIV